MKDAVMIFNERIAELEAENAKLWESIRGVCENGMGIFHELTAMTKERDELLALQRRNEEQKAQVWAAYDRAAAQRDELHAFVEEFEELTIKNMIGNDPWITNLWTKACALLVPHEIPISSPFEGEK